jgi:U2-associated protein SR140
MISVPSCPRVRAAIDQLAWEEEEGGGADEDEEMKEVDHSTRALLSSLLSPSSLTLGRQSILRAMGGCVDQSVRASLIVRVICGRIARSVGPSSSTYRLALLYLLSDCLYNSTAPVAGASVWRREVTSTTGQTSEAVQSAMRRWGERTVGKRERDLVVRVLRAWQGWSLVDERVCVCLLSLVEGEELTVDGQRSRVGPSRALEDEELDGVPLMLT